ncbi:MAG: RNA polymerase sigma factor [Nocardioidaceae bacterium]|nr:RNA polymerase sigma factor [Nocardioidaceae bacterium]
MTSDDPLDHAVQQMLAGDEASFRVVYRAVQPALLRYLTVMVGAEAEDVASEAWAQAFRDLSRFSGDADGFRGWLTTIARNRALDHLRRQSRRPVADVGLELVEDRVEVAGAEELALGALSTDEAIALIGTLPREQAEAVVLRSVLGFDAKTAAEILGKRPGAVRTAAHRGLSALAQRLEREGRSGPSARRSDISGTSGAEGMR